MDMVLHKFFRGPVTYLLAKAFSVLRFSWHVQIDWPEGAASTKEAPSLWRPLCKKTAAQNSPVSHQKVSSTVECNSFMIGAVLIGGLAIAAGLGYMVS